MALYRYTKSYPKKKLRPPQIVSYFFIFSGISVMLWVVWPILMFQIITSGVLQKTISPIQENQLLSLVSSDVVLAAGTSTAGEENLIDANNWYPARPQLKGTFPVDSYTLSIPKLKIYNARVVIAGDSLDQSLIHYGGTAVPGTLGTAVIFGHSSLPQLYKPTDYKTIFTQLPQLHPTTDDTLGDEMFITLDGVTFKYVVFDMNILKPTDLSILDQQRDASYVTLVTCVPPGTLWERLEVKAKLVPY